MKAPKNKVPGGEDKKKMPKLPERGGRSTKHAKTKSKRKSY